jgi:hypothetical protein
LLHQTGGDVVEVEGIAVPARDARVGLDHDTLVGVAGLDATIVGIDRDRT